MAYNSREWDRGKEYRNDASWGGNTYDKINARGREDDNHGEGKRRKYNNGGYDAGQQHDSVTGYDASGYGHGRQADFTQDGAHDDRNQRFQPKKRLVPSEPSPHVIFLGLDPDFTEADLQAYLQKNGCSVETVTIIRERTTGVSKGFGFAQFTSTDHARAFVDPFFPFIQVPPPASHGASATAAFYKALETGVPHNGRRVKIDYSQSAMPHEKARARQNMNDGTRDIGNTQAPILLFRGLDPLSGPQAIAQAMMSSSGPGKEGAKGMKRIMLIKDKVTMASFGFAFVEFIDVQSAAAVLAATMSPLIHPSGFRISDRPVAASFAHPYSFQPVDHMLRDDAAIPSSVNLGGAEDSWVRYWDETSTVAVLEFKVEEPAQIQPVMSSLAKEKKEKKKMKESEHVSNISKQPQASVLPVSDKPVTLNFNKGGAATKQPVVSSVVLGFSAEDFNAADDTADQPAISEDNKVASMKKVAPLIASKKVASNINKWNHVQEELSATETVHPANSASTEEMSHSAPPIGPLSPSKSSTPIPQESEFEFSDANAMTCLLCARQFKSLDQLKRHNGESDLHKKNMKDASLRDLAREKAKNVRPTTTATSSKSAEQPRYRDRASERRTMHNQPEVPVQESSHINAGKKRHAEGPPPPQSPPSPPINPGQDESNVGNKLLKMMGWTEGSGLGSNGEGRVEPIQTAMYAQGVGLGASKAKEVGKYAEGYTGYVQLAQDAARERYNT